MTGSAQRNDVGASLDRAAFNEHLRVDLELVYALTDGRIALNNLESARRQSWSKFWLDPLRPGVAESIVEQEQLTLQFAGDPDALDRLDALVSQLERVDADSPRTFLIRAQVASTGHRFTEARECLNRISGCTNLSVQIKHLSMSIDQACGTDLASVLEGRRRIAEKSGRLEDLVPLAALYADLRKFDHAVHIYQRALNEYQDTSPLGIAWVCFQLGMLWGELVPESNPTMAAVWYQRAIGYLPRYVKARVHLAEIYLRSGRTTEAEALLIPVLSSGDAEVSWRLADVLVTMGRFAEAAQQMLVARSAFEALLGKHMLAFADHGAEFYAGSGNDLKRALELAVINVSNRPTLRAFEQAYEIAADAGETQQAVELFAAAKDRWGDTATLVLSQSVEAT